MPTVLYCTIISIVSAVSAVTAVSCSQIVDRSEMNKYKYSYKQIKSHPRSATNCVHYYTVLTLCN